jgi:hypothetical protein
MRFRAELRQKRKTRQFNRRHFSSQRSLQESAWPKPKQFRRQMSPERRSVRGPRETHNRDQMSS